MDGMAMASALGERSRTSQERFRHDALLVFRTARAHRRLPPGRDRAGSTLVVVERRREDRVALRDRSARTSSWRSPTWRRSVWTRGSSRRGGRSWPTVRRRGRVPRDRRAAICAGWSRTSFVGASGTGPPEPGLRRTRRPGGWPVLTTSMRCPTSPCWAAQRGTTRTSSSEGDGAKIGFWPREDVARPFASSTSPPRRRWPFPFAGDADGCDRSVGHDSGIGTAYELDAERVDDLVLAVERVAANERPARRWPTSASGRGRR